jgi:hypothetical protein
MNMSGGVIYYSDNLIEEPIKSAVMDHIFASRFPIVSVTLEPTCFGKNITLERERGYVTYVRQIVTALSFSVAGYVFFCEHDVLYPLSHFDFIPPKDDIFYYNSNVWRWEFGSDKAITYDRMLPLSVLCVNREFALDHYKKRLKKIEELGEEVFASREPAQARKWGYEPGTKKTKRGGFSNDNFETWESEVPVIDIRHWGTFSPTKTTLESFKHEPKNWREIPVSDIPGWKLKEVFKWN